MVLRRLPDRGAPGRHQRGDSAHRDKALTLATEDRPPSANKLKRRSVNRPLTTQPKNDNGEGASSVEDRQSHSLDRRPTTTASPSTGKEATHNRALPKRPQQHALIK